MLGRLIEPGTRIAIMILEKSKHNRDYLVNKSWQIEYSIAMLHYAEELYGL